MLEVALERARRSLLERQGPDGAFRGALPASVTPDSEDILMREFLGIRAAEDTRLGAEWIRSQRRPDGSFAHFAAGPPDLSASVKAYAALRLAGDPADAAVMLHTARAVRDLGGVECASVDSRFHLALFGLWPWRRLPAFPPEVVLLRRGFPLRAAGFEDAGVSLALSIAAFRRPIRPLLFRIDELSMEAGRAARIGARQRAGTRASLLERALSGYRRWPLQPLRRRALARCVGRIVEDQGADGTWGGVYAPSILSLVALQVSGHSFEHPVMQRGLAGVDSFVRREFGTRRVEARPSPVWDTALAVSALRAAGLRSDHPALLRAARWLLERELPSTGGWSEASTPDPPQIEGTAEVVMALRSVDYPQPLRVERAVARAVEWTLGVRSRHGGWARRGDGEEEVFEAARSPFAPESHRTHPAADLTARVIEMLAREGLADDAAVSRALDWVVEAQEGIGSWPGSSDLGALDATAAAVRALAAVGEKPASIPLQRSVRWLSSLQNPDGGWGNRHTVSDESTAPHTACAMLALLAAGERGDPVRRGAEWLAAAQTADGRWAPLGAESPRDIRHSAHRLQYTLPTLALGRYLQTSAGVHGSS